MAPKVHFGVDDVRNYWVIDRFKVIWYVVLHEKSLIWEMDGDNCSLKTFYHFSCWIWVGNTILLRGMWGIIWRWQKCLVETLTTQERHKIHTCTCSWEIMACCKFRQALTEVWGYFREGVLGLSRLKFNLIVRSSYAHWKFLCPLEFPTNNLTTL